MADHNALLRPMTQADLEQVLAWRNHPSIRQHMTTRHEISLQEHENWFRASARNPNRSLLIFQFKGIECGFLSFNVNPTIMRGVWGFYLAPERQPGAGRALGQAGVHYGFHHLGLEEIFGEVRVENLPSIRFHERLGFTRISNASINDYIHFLLTRSNWLKGV